MKKLLIVVNVGWFFISHRLPLAVAAKRVGYEVHVAAGLEAELDSGTVELIRSQGLAFHQLPLSRRGSSPVKLFREIYGFIRLYRRVSPDIVHLVALKPILLGGICARLARLQYVVLAIPGRGSVFSARGAWSSIRRWIVLKMYRLAYSRRRNRVIVQNVEDRKYFVDRRIFEEADVRLIRGSGVNLAEFCTRPEPIGPPIVIFASRMLREKGVQEFVEAAIILMQCGVTAKFILVGEPDHGNPGSHTVEELRSWVESGAVEWWGFRSDMQMVFAQCHLVCLPTYYGEGVPKVLVEAAACGRAIVTTDTPGCRDIVKDGHNGLLVPPKNVSALANALGKLIEDREMRQRMGESGRQRVEREFSLDSVIEQTLDIYGEFSKERHQCVLG